MNIVIGSSRFVQLVFFFQLIFTVDACAHGWRWGRWLVPSDPVKDIIDLHKKLFTSWSTYKTLVAFFPPFIVARMFDERIQNCFYCKKHHKNVHQLPRACHDIAHWGVTLPMAMLASTAFLSKNYDHRITGWIFLLGMPFVILGKDMFKKVDVECNLRPWNEHFSHEKRSLGGFPSGHVAELTYMAVLYGKRYGRRCAIPLAAGGLFVALSFVNCNRHYFSQVVGGAALGTIYALAAHALIESKLASDLNVQCVVDASGAPAFKVSYTF